MTTVKRSGLGKNLSALLSPNTTLQPVAQPLSQPSTLELQQLKPGKYQPRSDFSEASLSELAQSIKQQGLLQPIVVRKTATHYEILAGERRWRACQMAGLTHAPVIVKAVDDETAMAIALVENLQREDLNAMEQARAIQRLTTEFSLTHQHVADMLAKSRASISNTLRLLNLSDEVKTLLEHGDLDMGHGRAMLALNDAQQSYVAQLVIVQGLSVRETEKLVNRVLKGHEEKPPKPSLSPQVENALASLAHQFNTAIQLKQGKRGKGAIVISYQSERELASLLEQLKQ